MKRIIAYAIVTLITALSCVYLYNFVANLELKNGLIKINSYDLAFGFLLVVVMLLIRFSKWRALLINSYSLKRKELLLPLYLAGILFSMTPAKLGENIKNIYLKRLGISHRDSIFAFIAEKVTDVLALLILLAICTAVYGGELVLFICISVLIVVSIIALYKLIDGKAYPLFFKFRLPKLILEAARHLTVKKVIQSVCLGIASWLCPGFYIAYLLEGAHFFHASVISVAATSLGTLAGTFSILPAGIGTYEGGTVHALTIMGVDAYVALSVTLSMRVVFIFSSLTLGAINFIFIYYKMKRLD